MAKALRATGAILTLNGVEFECDLVIGDADTDPLDPTIPTVAGASIDLVNDDPRAANKLAGFILLADRTN